MIRVVIAEDHAIVRSGLRQILALSPGIEVVGEAVDGGEVLERLRGTAMDLLLLDLNMPGLCGPDMIARIKSQYPQTPVLVLSMHDTAQVASRALRAGARGYVTKDSEPEVLLGAIRKVAGGGQYITPELAEQLVFSASSTADRAAHESLSDREMDVFRRLVGGHSVNDIAAALFLSNKTVSTHKARLMEKIGVGNLPDLVLYAVHHGLMPARMAGAV